MPEMPHVSAGTRLLGEIITWTCPGAAVPHLTVVEALGTSGLDCRMTADFGGRTCRGADDEGRCGQAGQRLVASMHANACTATMRSSASR